ncbi:MAG: hypothetical protein AAB767_00235 [Patescibacteria group bacterium]
MCWKLWPYWIKGGIWGGVVYGIAVLYLSKTMASFSWVIPIPPWMDIVTQPFIYVVTFIGVSLRLIGIDLELQNSVGMIVWYTCMFLSGFLMGVVVGYLYGKFKNRRKVV